jgi:hypothetical protein
MKSLTSALRVFPLLLLVSATPAWAEEFRQEHFAGIFNDYAPSTVAGGPYEMHGQWSLDLRREWRSGETIADFAADMTMAGYVTTVVTTPPNPLSPSSGTVNVQTQGGVAPHTHHISMTNVRVTFDMTGCPNYVTNPSTVGFQINSTVNMVTGNGSNAPFETTPPSSMLQVCVTGGTEIESSNVTLVFTGPATKHFGPQAIHGVVRKT